MLVHCAAGVHRGPVVAALVLACLTDQTFLEALEQIRRLRAIEPERIFREDRELPQWCAANTSRAPKKSLPSAWAASLNRGDAPSEPATEPVCQHKEAFRQQAVSTFTGDCPTQPQAADLPGLRALAAGL